ncbi:GMC family oxidoreductase [Polyangium jinanense]|uniref:GMC family oxidoreductase n=1 Tax=Polyangium jinanense TaxID=2829994 RepID=A0A9X3X7F4_9BACT|nr:GMC family oxidoreductase [Polyangium jinanense]MDC3960527.1 GMC family oxidoreductase [Polyangium jinanense]MDC3985389.1 GMC family oxidoreductase [Polyangium jinanense]
MSRRKFVAVTGGVSLGIIAFGHALPGVAKAETPDQGDFDFIVCGTGSGGAIVINRLVNEGFKVLALEAGIDMPTPNARRAEGTQSTFDDYESKDWPYVGEPETTGYGFQVPMGDQAMGKMVGGSSHHYGMVCYRAAPEDYDEWDHYLRDGAGSLGNLQFVGTNIVSGNNFTSELKAGDYIRLDQDGQPFRVVDIIDDEHLQIDPGGLPVPTGSGPGTKLTPWNRSSMLTHYKKAENDIDIEHPAIDPSTHSGTGYIEIGRIGGPLLGDTRPNVTTPRINPVLIDIVQSLTNSAAHDKLPLDFVDDINDWNFLANTTNNFHKAPLGYVGFDSQGNPVAGGRQSLSFHRVDKYDERRSALIVAIDPVRDKPNLKLESQAVVNRVLFVKKPGGGLQTAGVEYLQNQNGVWVMKTALCPNVILAAGPYGTPAILLRSGVGDPKRMPKGTPLLHKLPGVGANILQHVGINIVYRTRRDLPLMFQGLTYGGRLRTDQVRTDPKFRVGNPPTLFDESPEIVYLLSTGNNDLANAKINVFDHGLAAKRAIRTNYKRLVRMGVANYKPRSRGRGVFVESPDPRVTPKIFQGLLNDPAAKDAEALVEAAQVTHAAMMDPSQPFFQNWLDPNFTPIVPTTVQQLHPMVSGHFHASGTCGMGPASNPMAVCDEQARVYGIEGLRIADCSIFPTHVRANNHLPITAHADLIADMIIADESA